jgi:hypothetical protein
MSTWSPEAEVWSVWILPPLAAFELMARNGIVGVNQKEDDDVVAYNGSKNGVITKNSKL